MRKAGIRSATTTTASSSVLIPFDTVEYGNTSDLVDGKFKPSVEGYYNIFSCASCSTATQTRAFLEIFKNEEANSLYRTTDITSNIVRVTDV